MIRRPSVAVTMIVMVVLLVSCRRQDNSIPDVETQDRIIQTASLTDDPSQVLVTWDPAPCETFEGTDVELTDEEARILIRVSVDVETCPPGGFDQTVVELGEPLDNRKIYDLAFRDRVALESTIFARAITSATAVDPDTIEVTWETEPCERFDRVEVELDDTAARLRIVVIVDDIDCPQGAVGKTSVDLGRALDGRRVIDATSNTAIELTTG